MVSDPIVDEVRLIRQQHAERFDYDLWAIAADLREREKQHQERLVSLPPKQPHRKRTAS